MIKFFTDILTGVNNKSYDIGRVISFCFCVCYAVYPFIQVFYLHQTFDIEKWAIGAAALMSGSGAFIYLKKETEPKK